MIRGIQIGKRCLYRLRANSALVLGSKFVAPFRCASSAISQTEFNSEAAYLASVESRAALPQGFRVGTSSFNFVPPELPSKMMAMTLTVIALDKPSPSFAALFTKNAFPGAPVIVGRALTALPAASLQAIVINNKVSNVCAPGGVEAAQKVAAAAAKALGAPPNSVLPCSTGIIGWRIPASELVNAMPAAAASLQRGSALPAAKGICTTDLYPKVRSQVLPGGARIVGIAKGAGMVEPGLATMLVYIMTDAVIDAAALKTALKDAVEPSFNSISIDTDMSTSDTVVALSSNAVPLAAGTGLEAFRKALSTVCLELANDVVRNGEGVAHVIRVRVHNAPTTTTARAVGKSIVNSPLFKCAVYGNDPNVGRLVAAIGKCLGAMPGGGAVDTSRVQLTMGGRVIFKNGSFALDGEAENALIAHLKAAQLWESSPRVRAGAKATSTNSSGSYALRSEDVSFETPLAFPPHERCVEIDVDLGQSGGAEATVLGADLTYEYVAENGAYRS